MKPLDDVIVRFGHESLLGRAVAIRFVVGVNGSGKTRLMQALTKAFLCLERGTKPSFHITLAYDIGSETDKRTIFWRYQANEQQNNGFIEFARLLGDEEVADWESLRSQAETNTSAFPIRGKILSPDEMQGASLTYALPRSLLVYTSGAIEPWQELFTQTGDDVDLPEEISEEDERPWDWDEDAEARYQLESGEPTAPTERAEASAPAEKESIGFFVQPENLKLVACAVTLVEAAHDFRQMSDEQAETAWHEARAKEINKEQPANGLRSILNEIGWLYPLTIGLRINYDLERWKKNRANLFKLSKLYDCATSVLREPAGQPIRTLYFDLEQPLKRESNASSTAAALLEALGDEDDTEAFTIFRALYDWQRQGLLMGVSIALKKHGLDDVLLYDWLSDGERVFLGRMALLHLMGKYPDSLIILDEPETHFNDYWKRRIVDVIDDNLRDMPSEIVISTHSSIALTDVFATEITLLEKDGLGSVYASTPTIQTFGALPSEIMIKVFGAPEVVGQRASEYLDMLLTVSSFPKQVESVWEQMWSANGNINDEPLRAAISGSKDFKRLWSLVKRLPYAYETDRRLYDALSLLLSYTRRELPELNRVRLADALQVLFERLGTGYYSMEFYRRLQRLEKR